MTRLEALGFFSLMVNIDEGEKKMQPLIMEN
jgi:hypothetical protein